MKPTNVQVSEIGISPKQVATYMVQIREALIRSVIHFCLSKGLQMIEHAFYKERVMDRKYSKSGYSRLLPTLVGFTPTYLDDTVCSRHCVLPCWLAVLRSSSTSVMVTMETGRRVSCVNALWFTLILLQERCGLFVFCFAMLGTLFTFKCTVWMPYVKLSPSFLFWLWWWKC